MVRVGWRITTCRQSQWNNDPSRSFAWPFVPNKQRTSVLERREEIKMTTMSLREYVRLSIALWEWKWKCLTCSMKPTATHSRACEWSGSGSGKWSGASPKIGWAEAERELDLKNTVEREPSDERGLEKEVWTVSGNFPRSRSAHTLWNSDYSVYYTNRIQIQIQMGICRARLTNCPGVLTNVRMLCETGEL